MKIKKSRFRSPEGSSIMTIASIDRCSNDYGNNITLAGIDNLPKNSDGIPELPLYGPVAARILKDVSDNN